ncbi:alpha/beta hydrolase [Adhaeribacter rhizoryzae]|uniref:Esterase family protein n=1 Tax=Adhaeribacter rhizoryzae TaxID=2607907 RepID=A0A5M6DCH1_9BACT|nr:alpha/beta hydrolase family protein [Adhaeribacter rhizoryzae]KAA5542855.1 esterase family protein [Adhaeribacter rhizoryzae]
MRLTKTILFLCCLSLTFTGLAARVDTLTVKSLVLGKASRAGIVLPDSYRKSKAAYPVLYLLHGGRGNYRDWLSKTPDKQLVHRLADQYQVIIVTPDAGYSSYYVNSPVDKSSQYETYITHDLLTQVDETYRTIRDRKGRIITGLSMGGHGALYLATRHPNLYCAAGSMSGALDLNTANWKLPAQNLAEINGRLENIMGPRNSIPDFYQANSVVNLAEKINANKLALIIDCGVDDFLLEPNRELHRRLVYNKTPHDYTERPGGHTWEYWENALPYHLIFFQKVWQANGALKM